MYCTLWALAPKYAESFSFSTWIEHSSMAFFLLPISISLIFIFIFSLLQLFHRQIYTKLAKDMSVCGSGVRCVCMCRDASYSVCFLAETFHFSVVLLRSLGFSGFFSFTFHMFLLCCLPCGKNIVLSNRKPMKTSHFMFVSVLMSTLPSSLISAWFYCFFSI